MKKNKIILFAITTLISIFISQKIFVFQDYSPTIIIENHKLNHKTNQNFYQGDKAKGEFKAKHDKLGIVSIKFDTHWDINTDFLQFSIKEKGQSNWSYSNKYKVDQFQNNQYFPFGFPETENSKNKTYQIEIESLYGIKGNSVTLSPNNEPFLTKYNFPKNYLLQNKKIIPIFLIDKIGSVFRHIEITSYIFIFISTIIIYFFLKSKKCKLFFQYFKENKSDLKSETSIFYWYFWTLGLIILISFIVLIIKKHNEPAEWLAYELSAIISFFALLKFNIFNKKISPKLIKITLISGIIILLSQLIFFKFYLEIISWRYLIIAVLALIPAITYNNHSTQNFLKIFLINLLSIICVSGYFVFDIDSYTSINFIILMLVVIVTSFLIIKNNIFTSSKLIRIVCPIFLMIFILFSVNKPIDYHHYSYYVGPTYEVSQHKSILTQSPSQYGYLSIHFVKNILSPFGINFITFHQLNIFLYVIYFICIYLIILKITKNTLIATILSIIAMSFQTMFSIDSATLYPSTGPLRFGLSILVILSTLYFSNNIKILIPILISSISFFWSVETALYIIPAWIFTIICQNYIYTQKIKSFFVKSTKELTILFSLMLLIFLIIFTIEWIHIKSIPNVLNYFQFANAYKGGYGSELIPKFNNYYIAIITLLLGSTMSIFCTFNKIKNNFTLPLNFIAIHNIALFSYFISRSNQSNLVNISIFLLIELILCYKVIEMIFFKNNPLSLLKYIIFPTTLFITLFGFRCIDNVVHPTQVHHSFQETPIYIENYKKISRDYGLNQNNVLIISKDNSSQIISEFKINTILPLNPTTMTTLLPNYQNKYLIPNLSKINIGTTLVYTKDMPELIDFFNQHFTLKPIKLNENGLFELFTLERKNG